MPVIYLDVSSCHQYVTAWINGYPTNQEKCETDKVQSIFVTKIF